MSRPQSSVTMRPATVADAKAIAHLSRDLIETGLGWSWTPERVTRAIQDRNTLTVIATESYEEFAENLQKEIEKDTGIKFGIVE